MRVDPSRNEVFESLWGEADLDEPPVAPQPGGGTWSGANTLEAAWYEGSGTRMASPTSSFHPDVPSPFSSPVRQPPPHRQSGPANEQDVTYKESSESDTRTASNAGPLVVPVESDVALGDDRVRQSWLTWLNGALTLEGTQCVLEPEHLCQTHPLMLFWQIKVHLPPRSMLEDLAARAPTLFTRKDSKSKGKAGRGSRSSLRVPSGAICPSASPASNAKGRP